MIRLACLGGTGDSYLVCALAHAVREHYGHEVMIALKERQRAIPLMFDLHWQAADEEIAQAEAGHAMQANYENRIEDNRTFYAHPCFTRSGVRVDDLTTLPGSISQADMYRALMGLPLDALLALPKVPSREHRSGSVLMIPSAVSWPNDQPGFWVELQRRLAAAGWETEFNRHEWSLAELLERAVSAEMVVGPQCGLMSILVAAEFPCRKVIATPSIDEGPGFPVGRTLLRKTYPYGYVTKFTGHDYDVEEYRVTAENHAVIIDTIIDIPRAPRDPRPVTTINMPLTPGDFLDRLAVLMVKRDCLGPGVVDRELARYAEARPSEWNILLRPLVDLHFTTFDVLAETVPIALKNAWRDDHAAVVLNKTRVELKQKIDETLRAPYRETKSYW